MTGRDLLNALDGLNAELIADAAPREVAQVSAHPGRQRIALVVCFCSVLLLGALLAVLLKPTPTAPLFSTPIDGSVGTLTPDKIYTFQATEKMLCLCGDCYAVFEHLYLTHTVGDVTFENGGYLIFEASVFTDHHWLSADSITLTSEVLEDSSYRFDQALSEQHSDTKKTFDRATVVLRGKLCLIFRLDENAYQMLAGATSVDKLLLSPDMAWRGGRCLFEFAGDRIEQIEKYVKGDKP